MWPTFSATRELRPGAVHFRLQKDICRLVDTSYLLHARHIHTQHDSQFCHYTPDASLKPWEAVKFPTERRFDSDRTELSIARAIKEPPLRRVGSRMSLIKLDGRGRLTASWTKRLPSFLRSPQFRPLNPPRLVPFAILGRQNGGRRVELERAKAEQ